MGIFSKIFKKITGWLGLAVAEENSDISIEKKGTNQGIAIIYGFKKKAKCVKVFKATTDSPGASVNDHLHLICVFCVGEIEEIGELYFNGIPESQIDSERLYVERFKGTSNQNHCASLTAKFNLWKSTAKLKNVAYAYVRLRQNNKVNWWQGEPAVSADIKGLKVFDPRDNQTKYTDNPALCAYDYLTNPWYGKGLSTNKIDASSFIVASNFVETNRTYTKTVYKTSYSVIGRDYVRDIVGTLQEVTNENLMSCNVSLDAEKTIKNNVETLLSGMRAMLPETNGKYRIAIEKDDPPVFAFTKNNLIGAIQCKGGSQSDRYNQVIVRFNNKLTGEDDEAVFPEDDVLHQQWKTEDNGKLLLGEFTFDTINNRAEALQMGHVIAHRSRNLLSVLFTGTPETIEVEAGDTVTLDSQIFGWNAKPFSVEAVDIDLETGDIAFQAVEHQNTIYPWAIADVVEEYADTSLALPQSISTPTNLAYTSFENEPTQGRFTWDDPNDAMVSSWEFQLISNVDIVVFSQVASTTFVDISTIPAGSYTAKLVAQNSLFNSNVASLGVTIEHEPTISGATKNGTDQELLISAANTAQDIADEAELDAIVAAVATVNTADKSAGKVGGWNVEATFIYSGTKQPSDAFTSNGITLDKFGALRAPKFRIDRNGDAFYKGNITGATGILGGWTIDSNSIYSGAKDTSGYSSNGITLGSGGSIHTPHFFSQSDGAGFKGAYIDNLSVSTLKLANQAITVPSSLSFTHSAVKSSSPKISYFTLTNAYSLGHVGVTLACNLHKTAGADFEVCLSISLVNSSNVVVSSVKTTTMKLYNSNKYAVPLINLWTESEIGITSGKLKLKVHSYYNGFGNSSSSVNCVYSGGVSNVKK